ncbi:hypothetical protein EDB83DRAFT_40550 [Lactarius deliciosus]|nr:hypothetical protein EDB83DRAFT_40550 [Lactarius deliciosus]
MCWVIAVARSLNSVCYLCRGCAGAVACHCCPSHRNRNPYTTDDCLNALLRAPWQIGCGFRTSQAFPAIHVFTKTLGLVLIKMHQPPYCNGNAPWTSGLGPSPKVSVDQSTRSAGISTNRTWSGEGGKVAIERQRVLFLSGAPDCTRGNI